MSEVLDTLEEVPHRSMIGSTTPPNVPISSGTAFASNYRQPPGNEFERDEQKLFLPANPFDKSADLETYDEQESPQSYQIKTGSRRGLVNHGFSSEESLEHPGSLLSVIPEESLIEVQLAESHDSPRQSQDLPQEVKDLPSQAENEVPWYHEEDSQDDWQTTPAYHRDQGVAVHSEENKATHQKAKKIPANNLHKVVVTEEMKPVLQVSLQCLSNKIIVL